MYRMPFASVQFPIAFLETNDVIDGLIEKVVLAKARVFLEECV